MQQMWAIDLMSLASRAYTSLSLLYAPAAGSRRVSVRQMRDDVDLTRVMES